ncbi:hypothetical protein HDU83_001953 [Entophlyctis luteolus]|nr:hypothetical protein HDU82_003788 [Entophlyctis luteolus]KAJ3347594.1 hypothetical protein HDU83_001953 [Entophlyctis luteolus]KAJ3384425.1 hypothetical protein HDU84_002943 [Entophlyctis sp. JEL0112]
MQAVISLKNGYPQQNSQMKIVSVFAIIASAAFSVSSLPTVPLPYQYCTSSGCTSRSTHIVGDISGNGDLTGVSTSGNSLTITGSNRVYLVNPAGSAYEPFYLKNRQFTFTIDSSQVPCGNNAAMYFTAMPLGDSIGSGYCDGQKACNEMDCIEANIGGQQFTPHPCIHADQSNSGTDCSTWGYGANTHARTDIGPGSSYTIDTTKPYTVTTFFPTDTGTDSGTLQTVSQTFTQGANTVNIGTITEANFLTLQSSNEYGGGMTAMSHGLDEGMVFILSLWGTANSGDMDWLDYSSSNAKCNSLKGLSTPTAIFSNFILSPLGGGTTNAPSTTTKTTTTTTAAAKTTQAAATTAKATSATANSSCSTKWGQCGGQGWTGPTCCVSSVCTFGNAYYSQCL